MDSNDNFFYSYFYGQVSSTLQNKKLSSVSDSYYLSISISFFFF